MKTTAKKKKTKALKPPVRQSYFMRKRRVIALLWARVSECEGTVPKSLEEAVEMSRQSRRWRKRLAKFTRLKSTAFPSHALLVDFWGREILLGAGTRKKMEALIDDSESIRVAGYKMVCLSDLIDGKQQVDKMKFVQGREEA